MGNFPIGFWNVSELEQCGSEWVEHWHDLGITQPMSPAYNEGSNKQEMLNLLDKAHEYDMQVIIIDYRTGWRVLTAQGEESYRKLFNQALADFGAHPAVMGFMVGDEPCAQDAADAFKAARIQREMAPHLMPYLNLLPWFDWIGERMGTPALAPYLDRAVNEGVNLLAYDCYSQMWEGDSGWDVYFNNLREYMMASLRLNVPFQTTLLSIGHYTYRCPNEDEMRWQLSTAVAHGASGILWFLIHLPNIWDCYRQAPIDQFGCRSHAFQWLSLTNRLFQALCGDIMTGLKIACCYHVHKAYGGMPLFKSHGKVMEIHSEKNIPLIFSEFKDANDDLYWVIVNNSMTACAQANMRFISGTQVEKCNFGNMFGTVPVYSDPLDQQSGRDCETVKLWLAPGQLVLLREKPAV